MELTLNFALLRAMCSCCPSIGNLLEIEEELKSTELSQMIGHKVHEAAMLKKMILWKKLCQNAAANDFLGLLSFHNVKTCKTTFVTKKDKPI